jgi:uncharacterized protein
MTRPKKIKVSQFYRDALQIMQSENADVKLATQLLRNGLDAGDPHAAYALGTWYFHGSNGVRKNKKRGIELWTIAAEAKISDALFDLAVCYEEGTVVERDVQRAFLFFMDAAIRGDKQAVFEVARCYTYGIGVSSDLQIAEIWSARAEELGTYDVA